MGCLKRNKRSCCGVPLALTALVMCLYMICNAVAHLVEACRYKPLNDSSNIITIAMASIELLFGSLGLIGILMKSPKLCVWGSKLIFPAILAAIASFVAQWWRWGWEFKGRKWEVDSSGEYHWTATEKWKPTGGEVMNIIAWTFFQLLYVFILIQLISVFLSLSSVFAAGGSGWRWKKATEYAKREELNKLKENV